jgi:uncharacterized phiE125 gp8 family phage protein
VTTNNDGAWKLITAPAIEPLTVEDAKQQLRIDGDADYDLLAAYIRAAREACEAETWRALITQTWETALPGWPSERFIVLPKPPLQSVTWVKYTTEDGTEHTLDSSLYRVDSFSEPGLVILRRDQSWPSDTLDVGLPVRVRYVAGYGATAASVPAGLVQGIKMVIAHWYATRETVNVGNIVNEVPMAAKWLWRLHALRY